MKKRLTLFSLLLFFTMTAMAQTLVDDIYYNLNESDNTAEVSGIEYSGDIVIPASISVDGVNYYTVTSIGDDAFRGYYLTSIDIPNSVTSIGDNAFLGCSVLTSIDIPTSVTSIGSGAFSLCSGLTSIVVEEGNSYYDSRDNCNAIIETASNTLIAGCQNTVIPNSVTSIGYCAFENCDGLTSIEIPNSVTSIADFAFRGCSGLTSIVVEEGNSYYDSRENCNAIIETASNKLIAGCQNTVIPTSVTSIGGYAFLYCSSLTSIEIPNSVTAIGHDAFCRCSGLTSIEIPNSVTAIGEGAFKECSNLTSIEIPNSVTSIGNHAFYQCSNLSSVSMQGVTPPTIQGGNSIFDGCSKLQIIYVPAGAAEAYNVAPWNAYNIVEKEIEIINPMLVDGLYYNIDVENKTAEVVAAPNDTKYSGDIVVPASISIGGIEFAVTSIESFAFQYCSGLTSIEIPNSVTSIGDCAFEGCSGLTSIEIPNSVTEIRWCVFQDCSGLTSIEIPNSVTEIGSYAFYSCSGLTSIEIPNSVTSIGEHAFQYCSGLTSIEIPNSVISIGALAFLSCSGLTSIEIPNSVTSIGDDAFRYCSGLTSIKISNSVASIGNDAFFGCSGLTSIVVEEGNYKYDSRENCNAIIETASNTLLAGCQNTVIPNSVTSIGALAFRGCSGLTSIEIPNSVTSIESSSFSYCTSLDSIYIPSQVSEIGSWVFAHCDSLSTIIVAPDNSIFDSRDNCNGIIETNTNTFILGCKTSKIPDSITGIADYAFDDCSLLTTLTIPGSVSYIGSYAFYKCSSLITLTIESMCPPSVGTAAFNNCNSLTTIYVPIGAAEAYNVAPWNAYNIVEYYEPRHNGTKNRSDRNVTAVKLTGESSGNHIYTLTSAEQSQDYTDVTASVVFQVEPGEILTPEVKHGGSWIHHAVYIDKDKNGFTGAIAAGSEWKPAGDLVSYSFYNNGSASDASGWNSVGEVINGYNRDTPSLPAFTAPTEPGVYRMRFVQDWCSIDPAGDADGKFGDFKDNGGQIVDVMLEVLNHVYLTDGEAYTNATEKETERITYTREFNNTQWQSWYVPFDMDYNDISDEYTAACLNDIHEYDDDEDGIQDRWTMEVLILRPGETIYANLPYVIRAKEVGEKQFVVENTMLYPADEQSMDCSSMRMHYTFTGTYSPIEAQVLRDNGWLAMGNGRLVTPTTTSTLKANRWYLESTPRKGYGSTYQAPKRIELVVIDENGEVTGVEELPLTEDENAVWPADVYDLNGRLVKAQAENLNELPKGVYIVRGEKIVK